MFNFYCLSFMVRLARIVFPGLPHDVIRRRVSTCWCFFVVITPPFTPSPNPKNQFLTKNGCGRCNSLNLLG